MTRRRWELAQGCPPQASTPHLPGCRWAFLAPGQGMPGRCACVRDSRKRSGSEQGSRFSGLHIALHSALEASSAGRVDGELSSDRLPASGKSFTRPVTGKGVLLPEGRGGGEPSACLCALSCPARRAPPCVRGRCRQPPCALLCGEARTAWPPPSWQAGAQRAVWAAGLGRGGSIFHGTRARAHPAQPESSIAQRSLPSGVLRSHPEHPHRNARRGPPLVLRPAWPRAGEGAEVKTVSGSGNPQPEPPPARWARPLRLALSAVGPSAPQMRGSSWPEPWGPW